MNEADFMRDNDRLVRHVVKNLLRKIPWYRRMPDADLRQAGRLGMLVGLRTMDRRDPEHVKMSTWLYHNIEWEIQHQYGGPAAKNPLWHAWPIQDYPDPRDDFEDIDDRIDARSQVAAAMRSLTSRLASAVCMRYGIGYDYGMTLSDVAKRLGVSRGRAREIILKGERKLRENKIFLHIRRVEWEQMQDRRAANQERLTRMRIAN